MSLSKQFKNLYEVKILLEVSSGKENALIKKMFVIVDDLYKSGVSKAMIEFHNDNPRLVNSFKSHAKNNINNKNLIEEYQNLLSEYIRGEKINFDSDPRMSSVRELVDKYHPTVDFGDNPNLYAFMVLSEYVFSIYLLFYIFEDIDPTNNMKYGNWLVDSVFYNEAQWNRFDFSLYAFSQRRSTRYRIINFEGEFFEDIPKIKSYLETYHKAKEKNILPNDLKDITNIKSYESDGKEYTSPISIIKAISMNYDPEGINENEDVFEIIDEKLEYGVDYDIMGKEDGYILYEPLTQKAMSYMGVGTEWCTTYGEYCTNKKYRDRTPIEYDDLIILIHGETREQLQFHVDSEQYMDAMDEPIDIVSFLFEHPNLFRLLMGEHPNLLRDFMYEGKYQEEFISSTMLHDPFSDTIFLEWLKNEDPSTFRDREIDQRTFKLKFEELDNPYMLAFSLDDLKEDIGEDGSSDDDFLNKYFETSTTYLTEFDDHIKVELSKEFTKKFILEYYEVYDFKLYFYL